MGGDEEGSRRVSQRRRFLRRLEGHGDVVAVEFTRDGFRTVFVEVAPEAGFDGELRCHAERLGYAVEPPGTTAYRRWRLSEWWEGSPEAVRVLRLDGTGDSQSHE